MTDGYLAYAFDLLNVGDLDVIAQARRHCDHLIVGVYSDEFASRVSGRSPIVPLSERLELVRYVRGVDEVVIHDGAESVMSRPGQRVFAVAGNGTVDGPAELIMLALTRTTRSPELLAALANDLESGAA